MKALLLSLLLALPAMADDAPRITKLPDGDFLVNKAAFTAIDTEVRRLQGVEQQHKGETWVPVLLVGIGVGLTAGLVVGVVAGSVLRPGS